MIALYKVRERAFIIWAVILSLLLIISYGCKAPAEIFTVGIINDLPAHTAILDGLKKGMAESGYIEGQNIRYIYNGITESKDEVIDAEIKKLLDQDIDLLFTMGNTAILRAKAILEGTDIPVITGAGGELVETGIVKSLSHPGGNITGVQLVDTSLKGLEWLKRILPNLEKVYVPYYPDEIDQIPFIDIMRKNASQMGIELVPREVHSIEDAIDDIENMPENVDAVFLAPMPRLDARINELNRAAIRKGIPIGAASLQDEEVLVSLTSDFTDTGKKVARLVKQIRQGISPADLPIETSDVLLTINLKTAEKMGITISNDILAQASKIIR